MQLILYSNCRVPDNLYFDKFWLKEAAKTLDKLFCVIVFSLFCTVRLLQDLPFSLEITTKPTLSVFLLLISVLIKVKISSSTTAMTFLTLIKIKRLYRMM